MIIRQEKEADYHSVFHLIRDAFQNEIHSDRSEHYLVERLRNSKNFIPELSIVAELDNEIIGYILLTRIKIKNNKNHWNSLALAPVAVLPKLHHQGIGAKLINYAHQKAKELNFNSIVVLGHPTYYPKFGYKMLNQFSIKLPFDAPQENCMAVELTKDSLKDVNGTVEYDKAFFEN